MKSFVSHYVLQRVTACILLILVPWFLWNIFFIKGLSYYVVMQNFGSPCSAALLFFMLISGFYHGYLGIQTICLDYMPSSRMSSVIIFVVGGIFSFLSIFGMFCLVRLVTLGH